MSNTFRRVTFFVTLFISCLSMSAQIATENFSDNRMGWTQREKGKEVVIKRGKLCLDSKGKAAISTCFAPMDINKPFSISVEVEAKKLAPNHTVGMMVDVEDEYNFILFQFAGNQVSFCRIINERLEGYRETDFRVRTGRKMTLTIEYDSNRLTFLVNGKKAMEYQKHLKAGESLVGTTGVGLYARGISAEFDNFEINQ